ncbi:MAG: bifunctional (p)ppGpp synthetase/guanosine-3',5'-bis(diphosphate) 3'-pyrophosphohydrolase [Alphaproteobacteria bacterium]|nr:bifunctional (p)ppGpp synthetase/guanosine-3',5'-bis(diphosphate) 3'-pyrophosphohydrolase [Alphaproteobacteria bacterium]
MDGAASGAVDVAPSAPAAAPGKPARARFLRQFELVERVRAYDPNADEALINRAYVYATAMHGSQKRHSGDPYFAHPIEVAGILTEYRLDVATIVAGLLHDTIEDTDATPEQIRERFGAAIAEIVEGVTKLSKLELAPGENKQAANLQKFILAMSRDVRVLLVKLADRLHNMRTLAHHPKADSRRRIALETLDIYAPLARRIGMDRMARELEELAFAEAYSEARTAIIARLDSLRLEKGENVRIISEKLDQKLRALDPPARIYGREKQPFSIWRKLQRKSVQFSDLADIYAFRAIVASEDQCYQALGLIHRTWRCVPEAFEDFVSNPKPNGYRSIHTTVIGPGNVRVEVQIRTEVMDYSAEVGVAAHWRYKNESYGFDAEGAARQGVDPREAVKSLMDIVEHGGDAEEFLEHAKLEMYQDHVFAFTPKGRLIALPQSATPLDFAYAVHSDIGDCCIGAVVNGEERPLRTALKNGDVVEVVCGPRAAPVPGWESLTKTGRAKSAQRRLERIAKRDEFIRIGREFVDAALHRYGHALVDVDLEEAAARLAIDTVDDVFYEVGEGRVKASSVAAAAFPGLAERIRIDEERSPMEARKARLYVQGGDLTPGVSLHFGACCAPIPGDRIVGVQEAGKGIVIHTIDCERLAEVEADSWVDLAWTEEAKDHALAVSRIQATVHDARGALAQICKVIAENEANILGVQTLRRHQDFYDIAFDIEVADTRHLAHVLAAMRTCRVVREAERVRR